MKTKDFLGIVTVLFSFMVFVSCESHEQKADEESDSTSGKSILANDTSKKQIIQVQKKTEPSVKNESLTDWEKFKIETEKKIVVNENKIKEIKSVPNENVQYFRKVANLEKDNNDLRKQMDDYRTEEKARWEKFKSQMNQDVSDIGKELGEMKVSSKGVAAAK